MNSFIYHINRYNTQLDLVFKQGWQFNQEGTTVPKCQGTPPTKKEVLTRIFSTLEKAPLYYAHRDPFDKFLTHITNYKNTANAKEKKEVEKVAKKINQLVKQRAQSVMSCFQGEPAKEVNVLLDKQTKQLTNEDYLILRELTTLFAFKRQFAHLFYRETALIETVRKLRREYPHIHITCPDQQGTWIPSIICPLPENLIDLHFWLFTLFQYQNNKNLAYVDENFIKEIIRRKFISQDVDFQTYLKCCLQLNVLGDLAQQWDQLNPERKTLEDLNQQFVLPKASIDKYSQEFIHEPPAYIELIRSGKSLRFFVEEGKEYGKLAEKLFDYYHDTNKDFDRWYKAIYDKLREYHTLHPEAKLPLLSPEAFASTKDFTGPEDITIPFLAQVKQWEKEVIAEINLQKTIPARPKKVKQPKPKPPILKEEVIPSPKPQELIKEEAALVLSKEKEEAPQEEPKKEMPPSEPTPIISQTAKIEPILASSAPKERSLKTPKKSLEQLLIETSPFQVQKRIIQWFIPNENLPVLNQESHFIHNFAWAANDILWQFGLRYPRKNEEGIYQPAIAMLCQVEHALFPKSEVFNVTVTFDHLLEEEPSLSPLSILYNPSWICYHRTLTRRPQNMNIVDEYIENGKKQFIDFPPLPSQRLHIELPSDLLEKKYPDGSFIESNSGSIITIRDPHHDVNKHKCRLHFFVVR